MFFSTIAQSTAAVVGFVIALSAIIYQIERQRREKRTDDLRDYLSEFRSKYRDIIPIMATGFGKRVDLLFESLGPSDPKYRGVDAEDYPGDHRGLEIRAELQKHLGDPLEADVEELEERFAEWDLIDKSMTILVYLHLRRVNELLDRIRPSSVTKSHYLLAPEEFDKLGESVEGLASIFSHRDMDQSQQLYSELRGAANDLEYGAFYSKTAFGGPVVEDVAVDEVTAWLLEYVRPDIADHLNTLKHHLIPDEELFDDMEDTPLTVEFGL